MYIATVLYPGQYYFGLPISDKNHYDRRLETLAGKKSTGSGFMLGNPGERDIDFLFNDKKSAEKFKKGAEELDVSIEIRKRGK